MTDSTEDTCFVCCEKFNRSNHLKIDCPFNCGYSACKECIRTYLVGSSADPHCMQCKNLYDEKFLVDKLNKSFVNNEYKIHRKKLLLEQQKARLPETMHRVEQYKKISEHQKTLEVYNKEIRELRQQLTQIEFQKRTVQREIGGLQSGKVEPDERQTFIMPCPAEDCRGFLSSAYKCEVCKCYTCPKCIQIIGYNKNAPEHTCDPGMVETANLIKKETKPCPSCGERIQKTQGCDQMWCIKCHQAFSWRTGKIDTGVVHNPHFYQHMRNGGGAVVRNPNDVMCGGLVNWWQIRNGIARYIRAHDPKFNLTPNRTRYAILDKLSQLHRTLSHIQNVNIPLYRRSIREEVDHTELRVEYILNMITEEHMAKTVYQSDRRRKKFMDLLHVYELFMAVGIDAFRTMENYTTQLDTKPLNMSYYQGTNQHNTIKIRSAYDKHVEALLNDFETELEKIKQVIRYCTGQLSIISATYACVVPVVSDTEFTVSNKKFTKRTMYNTDNMEITTSDAYPNGEGGV